VDHRGEALIGLVGAERDALELLEFAEEARSGDAICTLAPVR